MIILQLLARNIATLGDVFRISIILFRLSISTNAILHFQMLIQLQPQYLAVGELELELVAIEAGIVLVNDAVVVGADDYDIGGVIVLRAGEVVDVVRLHHAVAVTLAYLLASDLVAVAVVLFEHTDDAAVDLAVFHQQLFLHHRGGRVGHEESVVVARLIDLLGNGIEGGGQLSVVGTGTAFHAERVARRGEVETDVFVDVVGQGYLPLALAQELLLGGEVVIALLEDGLQPDGQRRLPPVAYLDDVLVASPVALLEVLVLQLGIKELAIDEHLDALARSVRQYRLVPSLQQRTCRHRDGHPVVEERPIHRLLHDETAVVVHIICPFSFLLFAASFPIASSPLCLLYPSSSSPHTFGIA